MTERRPSRNREEIFQGGAAAQHSRGALRGKRELQRLVGDDEMCSRCRVEPGSLQVGIVMAGLEPPGRRRRMFGGQVNDCSRGLSQRCRLATRYAARLLSPARGVLSCRTNESVL
jgi:hypothetical protein